jgi:hypothetical protein
VANIAFNDKAVMHRALLFRFLTISCIKAATGFKSFGALKPIAQVKRQVILEYFDT